MPNSKKSVQFLEKQEDNYLKETKESPNPLQTSAAEVHTSKQLRQLNQIANDNFFKTANARVYITNLIANFSSEFKMEIKAAEPDDSIINRMLNQIKILSETAKTKHLKTNFDNKGKMLPDKKNDITRLLTPEFSFYPAEKQGPLTIASFNKLLVAIQKHLADYPPNLHLLLSSFPVADNNGNFYNVAVHIQCGSPPKFTLIPKINLSPIDFVYPNKKFQGMSAFPVDIANAIGKDILSLTCDRTVSSITEGGAHFTTVMDICLDLRKHEGKNALRRRFSLEMETGKITLFSKKVSHVVTSATINAEATDALTPLIEQADAASNVAGIHAVVNQTKLVEQKFQPTTVDTFKQKLPFGPAKSRLTIKHFQPIPIENMIGNKQIPVDFANELLNQFNALLKLQTLHQKSNLQNFYKKAIYLHVLEYCALAINASSDKYLPLITMLLYRLNHFIDNIEKHPELPLNKFNNELNLIYSYLNFNADISPSLRPIFKLAQTLLIKMDDSSVQNYKNYNLVTSINAAAKNKDKKNLFALSRIDAPLFYELYFQNQFNENFALNAKQIKEDLAAAINAEQWSIVNCILLADKNISLSVDQTVALRRNKPALLLDLSTKMHKSFIHDDPLAIPNAILQYDKLATAFNLPDTEPQNRYTFYKLLLSAHLDTLEKDSELAIVIKQFLNLLSVPVKDPHEEDYKIFVAFELLINTAKRTDSTLQNCYRTLSDFEAQQINFNKNQNYKNYSIAISAMLEENQKLITACLLLNPESVYDGYETLARAFYRAHESLQAIDYYEKGIEIITSIPEAKRTEVDKIFLNKLAQGNGSVYSDLATEYFKDKSFASAVRCARKAVEADQSIAKLDLSKLRVLINYLEQYAAACIESEDHAHCRELLTEAKQYLEKIPEDKRTQEDTDNKLCELPWLLGQNLIKEGTTHKSKNDYAKAADCYVAAIEIRSKIPSFLLDLTRQEALVADYRDASDLFKTMAEQALEINNLKQGEHYYKQALLHLQRIPGYISSPSDKKQIEAIENKLQTLKENLAKSSAESNPPTSHSRKSQ